MQVDDTTEVTVKVGHSTDDNIQSNSEDSGEDSTPHFAAQIQFCAERVVALERISFLENHLGEPVTELLLSHTALSLKPDLRRMKHCHNHLNTSKEWQASSTRCSHASAQESLQAL